MTELRTPAEKPTEALFLRLAAEDPPALVWWTQQSISRGLLARAAEALGRVPDAAIAVPALAALLGNQDEVVQEGALYGLSQYRTPEAAQQIAAVAEDQGRHDIIRDIAREIRESLGST